MSSVDDETVAEAVIETLERILCKPRSTFRLTDRLVDDLRIASDDLSFMFVPELERKLGIRVPVDEWRSVYTGRDACELLKRYARR
jgi:acyl carrier protein